MQISRISRIDIWNIFEDYGGTESFNKEFTVEQSRTVLVVRNKLRNTSKMSPFKHHRMEFATERLELLRYSPFALLYHPFLLFLSIFRVTYTVFFYSCPTFIQLLHPASSIEHRASSIEQLAHEFLHSYSNFHFLLLLLLLLLLRFTEAVDQPASYLISFQCYQMKTFETVSLEKKNEIVQ